MHVHVDEINDLDIENVGHVRGVAWRSNLTRRISPCIFSDTVISLCNGSGRLSNCHESKSFPGSGNTLAQAPSHE